MAAAPAEAGSPAHAQALAALGRCDAALRPAEALRVARGVLRAFPRGAPAVRARAVRREALGALVADADRVEREVGSLVRTGQWRRASDAVDAARARHGPDLPTAERLRALALDLRRRRAAALGAAFEELDRLAARDPAAAAAALAECVERFGAPAVRRGLEVRISALRGAARPLRRALAGLLPATGVGEASARPVPRAPVDAR
ncbi:MAG: hypothetical protein D6731_11030 [Planctomycetota bacterium]|nr:MAG: hypothetical protein D6731_11030 [Planctomycetota bacterium]